MAECIDAVWLVVDNRHAPGCIADKYAWFDREQAELHAHNLRQHAGCSLDAIEVVRVQMLDDVEIAKPEPV